MRSFLERGVRVGLGWIRVVSAPPAQASIVVVLCSWAGVLLMWLLDVRLSLVEPFVERCSRPALGSSLVRLEVCFSTRVVLTPGHLCCPVVRDWWVPGSVGCWVVGSAAVAWSLAGWSVGGRGRVGLGSWRGLLRLALAGWLEAGCCGSVVVVGGWGRSTSVAWPAEGVAPFGAHLRRFLCSDAGRPPKVPGIGGGRGCTGSTMS